MLVEGDFYSDLFQGKRRLRVYLPPSYTRDASRRYPVLYLQDGQNVFTSAGTNAAFGWGNWELDRTADRLIEQKKMQEIIMVAVDCSAQRYQEYKGWFEPLKKPGPSSKFTPAEKYQRFIIEELKPRIDQLYRTEKGPKQTAVMGSSMGGIFSLSLAWQHPKIFGQAASLSGAFQVEKQEFIRRLQQAPKRKKPVRVYLDSGVIDFTGGDDERAKTGLVAAELRRMGWKDGRDLMHVVDDHVLAEEELEEVGLRRDKWKEAQKSQHNEFYWRQRAWRALTFLFPRT